MGQTWALGRAQWLLRNEFATVVLELDEAANSPRLKITDARTGRSGYLDALSLERLSRARPSDLAPIMSPSLSEPLDELDRL
ncbi:MAG: hypothetical protein ACSLE6_16700 [Mycobacterium sp.]